MLFQLCKQSLFFWPIGIEIEMETRLARGGSKVIKEIIDLKTPTTSANAHSGHAHPELPSPPTTHPPVFVDTSWKFRASGSKIFKCSSSLHGSNHAHYFLRLVAALKMTLPSWSRQIIVKWFYFNASVLGTLRGFPFYCTFWNSQPVSPPFVCFCRGQNYVSFKSLFWIGRPSAVCWQGKKWDWALQRRQALYPRLGMHPAPLPRAYRSSNSWTHVVQRIPSLTPLAGPGRRSDSCCWSIDIQPASLRSYPVPNPLAQLWVYISASWGVRLA